MYIAAGVGDGGAENVHVEDGREGTLAPGNEEKKTGFDSYLACFVNTVTLNMHIQTSKSKTEEKATRAPTC